MKKATKKDRRLAIKIETIYSESLFKNMHGDNGPTMTDRDLKAFSIDAFLHDIERDCKDGSLRRYVQFYIEEEKD